MAMESHDEIRWYRLPFTPLITHTRALEEPMAGRLIAYTQTAPCKSFVP